MSRSRDNSLTCGKYSVKQLSRLFSRDCLYSFNYEATYTSSKVCSLAISSLDVTTIHVIISIAQAVRQSS